MTTQAPATTSTGTSGRPATAPPGRALRHPADHAPSGRRDGTHPRPSRPGPGRAAPGRPTAPRPSAQPPAPPHVPVHGKGLPDLLTFKPRLPPTTEPVRTAASTRAAPAGSRTRGRPAAPAPGRQQQGPPDPARTAVSVVTAAAEVLAGTRLVDHLARWTTPTLFKALSRRAGLASRILGPTRHGPRPRARSVRAQATPSGACEATVLVEEGGRIRAAAARLEPLHGTWVLAQLEIG